MDHMVSTNDVVFLVALYWLSYFFLKGKRRSQTELQMFLFSMDEILREPEEVPCLSEER